MNSRSLPIFGWLLWQELRVFFQHFFANLVDALLLPLSEAAVAGYILPLMGIAVSFGSFILVGITVSMCLFHCVNKAQALVADIEITNSISYQLSLPIQPWLLFMKIGISFAITSACLNFLTIPIGKIVLGNLFDLTNLSIVKTFLIFITLNIFFGFYGLFIASLVKKTSNFSHVWMRFVLPLWMLGGYQYSWYTLKNAYPFFGYLSLINPLIYAFEGIRTATLGQEGSLNFWLCIGMLWLFIALMYCFALHKFKQRLDYV
jgi:ABC-2 type transport system permease protein